MEDGIYFNAARPQNFIFKINVILGCCGYIVLAFKKKYDSKNRICVLIVLFKKSFTRRPVVKIIRKGFREYSIRGNV